jgi:hypothetical protein
MYVCVFASDYIWLCMCRNVDTHFGIVYMFIIDSFPFRLWSISHMGGMPMLLVMGKLCLTILKTNHTFKGREKYIEAEQR